MKRFMPRFSLRSLLLVPIVFSVTCLAADIVATAVANTIGAVVTVTIAALFF